MARLVIPILALCAAAMAATILGAIAHDGLDIAPATIRVDALASAALVAAALASSGLFGGNS